MRILGLDTATRATTVALFDLESGQALESRDDPEPGARPRHTTRLMALIAETLDRVGCGWEEVDLLAAGVGPGTFTGLRIGVATARALAQARQIPVVGVSTLRSLALGATESARAGGHDAVVAVLDARRREVFAAAWPPDPTAEKALLEPVAIGPAALAERAPGIGTRRLAVGEGAVEFRAALEQSGTDIPGDDSHLHRVSAVYHCRLAAGREPEPPEHVQPEYLRPPDAELSLRAKSMP